MKDIFYDMSVIYDLYAFGIHVAEVALKDLID